MARFFNYRNLNYNFLNYHIKKLLSPSISLFPMIPNGITKPFLVRICPPRLRQISSFSYSPFSPLSNSFCATYCYIINDIYYIVHKNHIQMKKLKAAKGVINFENTTQRKSKRRSDESPQENPNKKHAVSVTERKG